MDWKRFFDNLGMNGTRWQWRIMRWQKDLHQLFRGGTLSNGSTLSLSHILITVNLVLFSLMCLHALSLGGGMRALLNPPTQLGLIHIGFNMMVLYQVGPLIESEIGKGRFIVLYVLTALTATGLGYIWHPMTPVVGASGSLFGLIGFAVTYYHRMGRPGLEIRNFMFRWAIFAFVFGLLVGADNAGHLGGALGGAALGLVLPLGVRGRKASAGFYNLIALLCFAAVGVSLVMLGISVISGL